jgi:hypothetical protein
MATKEFDMDIEEDIGEVTGTAELNMKNCQNDNDFRNWVVTQALCSQMFSIHRLRALSTHRLRYNALPVQELVTTLPQDPASNINSVKAGQSRIVQIFIVVI